MPPRRVWPWGVAVTQLREGGFDIRDEAVARLSLFLRHHINMLGRHSFGVDVVSDVDALGGERLPHGCRVLPAPAGIVRVENVFMWERACSMRVRVLRWGAWCSSCPTGSSVWPCSHRAGEGRLVSR